MTGRGRCLFIAGVRGEDDGFSLSAGLIGTKIRREGSSSREIQGTA